ncbi:carboxypeptidase-like regulatory domain-containing protein [Hymenobacter lucidus]|uniref:Carboxypeptidase-like regulatory domain-containing protein n=1 Tax=Hymenobacter lucidus TaxID=2880930 RepID=A0ABS8AUP4_9BACT|nr:carboxypeptidase-like regulatory domain-containing protein [Hymenobacter lucidus]MCB2408441.1 carboxypeptidase-like regulatory domain-containing protein [Hymenobacter lucidus]
MKLLLLLGFCLFSRCAQAQNTTVTGRILDRSNGQGLPGTTILQLNTNNGVSSNTDGSFSLTVPGRLDSVAVSLSAIGYVKQQRRIVAGDSVTIALELSTEAFGDIPAYALLEASLSAGLRYAPLGAALKVYGYRFIGYKVNLQGHYQTNLGRNYAALASLSLPPLQTNSRLSFTETLTYQQLQAAPANLRFRSYTATLGVSSYRIGKVLTPDLLLGGGYARYRPLQPSAETAAAAGYGYSIGLQYNLPHTLWAQMQVLATRWPGYWQLQGNVRRQVFDNYSVGVAYTQLRSYREASLTLSRFFY